MRIAIAEISQETDTFSPIPTELWKFEQDGLYFGDEILKKINYNFFQTFFNAVGERGPGGNVGATGLRGQAGRDGVTGSTGDRASNWCFSATEPIASQSQDGDVWIDNGATGGQQVYIYNSGSWVYTGETLLTAGEFSTLIGASGPGGSNENNAIYKNPPTF